MWAVCLLSSFFCIFSTDHCLRCYVFFFFFVFVFFFPLVYNLLVREPSVIPRPSMYKFFEAKEKKEKWKKKSSSAREWAANRSSWGHKSHESGSLVPRPPPLLRIKQHKFECPKSMKVISCTEYWEQCLLREANTKLV